MSNSTAAILNDPGDKEPPVSDENTTGNIYESTFGKGKPSSHRYRIPAFESTVQTLYATLTIFFNR